MQTCEDQGVVSEIVFCEQKFYNNALFQNTVVAYSVLFFNGELNYALVFSSNKNTFYIYGQNFQLINSTTMSQPITAITLYQGYVIITLPNQINVYPVANKNIDGAYFTITQTTASAWGVNTFSPVQVYTKSNFDNVLFILNQ